MTKDYKELFGNLTWNDFSPENVLEEKRKKNRIIGLSFPENNISLGLEPSILTVLPQGDNVEYCGKNYDFNDDDVLYYLCSVYISGYEEFTNWALKHDKSKIIVGGYHPTTFPEQFKRFAKKIVQGPCDDLFETIKQDSQIVSGIVAHKNLPRRDLYDISTNQQIIPDKKFNDISVSINTSIGCSTTPPCDFCCSPIMCSRVLSSPINHVEREANDLKKYNPAFCFIRDENFTQQKDWRERLQIIHSALPRTKLYLFASANTLNNEKAKFMKDNGVYMICLGLEDPTVEYRKNKTLDKIVGYLKNNGIMTYLSFIVNPLNIIGKEEGKKFYTILLNRIEELAPEMICGNFLMPFPGTALWDKFYAFVDTEDYKYYDSKNPFLIRNKVIQEKMKFFLFWYQWKYYTSDFYQKNVRNFSIDDTLHLRFLELYEDFRKKYEAIWKVRA